MTNTLVPYICNGVRYRVTPEDRKLLVEDKMLFGQCWIKRGDDKDERIDPATFYFRPMDRL